MDGLLVGKGEVPVRARKLGSWFIGLVAALAVAGVYGVKRQAAARMAQAERPTRNVAVSERAGRSALAAWRSGDRRRVPTPEPQQKAPASEEPAPRLDAEAPYRQLPLEALDVALGRAPAREEQTAILAARHRLASDNALAYLRLREGELDWDAYAAMLADHDQEFQHTLERLLRVPGDDLRVLTGL